MKLEVNRKYITIAVYAVLAVIAAAAVILGMIHADRVKNMIEKTISILSPFIWGFSLAFILNPVLKITEKFLNWISRGKLSRKPVRMLSILITDTLLILVLVIFFRIVIPQLASSITSLAALISTWVTNITPIVNQFLSEAEMQGAAAAGISSDFVQHILNTVSGMVKTFSSYLTTAIPHLLQATASLASMLLDIILGFIISIYLMASKETFFARIKKFLYAFFPEKGVKRMIELTQQSNRIFTGFITGKILDSCIIGVLCFVGMSLFRWPYAMLISVIVGVTNVIPYFGPFIGAIPSILILLIVEPKTAVFFGIFVLALQQLDGNVIGPKILGDSTGLSAFWVIFAITVFGSLLGPLGMFIGVPLFAVIYSLVREFANGRLKEKGLPGDTKAYASSKHPLI